MTLEALRERHPALSIEKLHAGYSASNVLTDVSLTIQRGEWYALLGPNGSGKTTLISCVASILTPRSGTITINGHLLSRAATEHVPQRLGKPKSEQRAAKQQLGFASAPDRLPKLLTGRQCLEIYAAAKGLSSIDDEILKLSDDLNYTQMLDIFVEASSLGTRQKLSILLALLGEPALVVLDEAFNGLDARSSAVVKDHLQARVSAKRCGILLATHATDIVAAYATHAGLLTEGRLESIIPSRVTETLRPR